MSSGASVRAASSASNAVCCCSSHTKGVSFFSSSCRGTVMDA